MPQFEWNDIDFLDFFAVEPTVEDYAVSHNYEVERNGLRLLFTVWQHESVIQVSIFHGDADDALVTFAAYVRAGARFGDDIRVFYDVIETAVEILGIVPKSEALKWLERYGESDERSGTV